MAPDRSLMLDLPLMLTGVPAAVQSWLRLAGVPFAPFRLGSPGGGRVVLYDSRIVASRCDAEAARTMGLKTIDILPFLNGGSRPRFALPGLLRGRPADDSARSRFFLQLKNAIERAGGVWARLADYPFPWQSAVCSGDGRFLPEFATLGSLFPERPGRQQADTAGAETARWSRDRYSRGLPFASADRDDPPDPLAEMDTPLLWRASFAEFARWWRTRSRLTLQLRREQDIYEFSCEGQLDGFRPTLELWQGEHVALLPLPGRPTLLRRSGLPFQYEPRRLPAGLASQFAGSRHEEPLPAWRQSQSA
jgi:hypothetical protein